jgi:hypothetical protein
MLQIGHLALVPPTSKKFTVALPVRKPNAEYRSREHLTEKEVERLIEAAKGNRWGAPRRYRPRLAKTQRASDAPGASGARCSDHLDG